MEVVQKVFSEMKAIFDIVIDFIKGLFDSIKGADSDDETTGA